MLSPDGAEAPLSAAEVPALADGAEPFVPALTLLLSVKSFAGAFSCAACEVFSAFAEADHQSAFGHGAPLREQAQRFEARFIGSPLDKE